MKKFEFSIKLVFSLALLSASVSGTPIASEKIRLFQAHPSILATPPISLASPPSSPPRVLAGTIDVLPANDYCNGIAKGCLSAIYAAAGTLAVGAPATIYPYACGKGF